MKRIIRLTSLGLVLLVGGCLAEYKSVRVDAGPPPAPDLAPPPPPPAAPAAAAELARFGRCITQADWVASGIDGLADQLSDSGSCRGCHMAGLFGVYLSKDSAQNLAHMQTLPFLYKLAAVETNADGTLKDIVPSTRLAARGQENTLNHPSYTLSVANQQALTQLFSVTKQRYQAGGCP